MGLGRAIWERNEQKSAIDFVIVNSRARGRSKKFLIDEEGAKLHSMSKESFQLLLLSFVLTLCSVLQTYLFCCLTVNPCRLLMEGGAGMSFTPD